MKNRKKSDRKIGDILFRICNYVLLICFAVICLYPFYYIFLYSISDPAAAELKGIFLLPVEPSLHSYKQLLEGGTIFYAILVSASRAVIGTCVTVTCCSFFAYLVSKKEMPGRKIIYRMCVLTMYINAGLIPWYITMKKLGLKNNYLLYILPFAILGFYVILFKTYVEQLPASLEEAAQIDGAGFITCFVKVIFPLSKPIVATIAIFSAVTQWNAWQDNLYLVSNQKLMTLQLLLYNYLNSNVASGLSSHISQVSSGVTSTPTAIKMTICMITALPIIIVYPLMQKYFAKGILLGAVKG